MEIERWLDQLRQELERQRVPRRYINRLVGELSDHFTDFMEDSMNKDVQESTCVIDRLGEPGPLAERAAEEYRRGRFAARHPWLMFGALSPLMLLALWIGFVALALGFAWMAEALGVSISKPAPLGVKLVLATLFFTVFELPIVLTAAHVCRAAARSGLSWKWPLFGCLLVSLIAIQVCPRAFTSSKDGSWFAAVAFPYVELAYAELAWKQFHPEYVASLKAPIGQLVQFSMPLLVATWSLQRHYWPLGSASQSWSAG